MDAIVQPRRLCNEGRALADLVDRSPIKGKTIVIADRGYESYNNFAHIERKGRNYVIRVKDLGSSGILSGLRLPSSGEFDLDIHLTLTKKLTKATTKSISRSRFTFVDISCAHAAMNPRLMLKR